MIKFTGNLTTRWWILQIVGLQECVAMSLHRPAMEGLPRAQQHVAVDRVAVAGDFF